MLVLGALSGKFAGQRIFRNTRAHTSARVLTSPVTPATIWKVRLYVSYIGLETVGDSRYLVQSVSR